MTEPNDRPAYSFNPGPPPEASRFLKNKGLMPGFSWKDVEPEEHAVMFSVAKAMQVDVLTTLRNEVQRALDEGITFDEFQKTLRPRLRKMGWWGQQEMVDPQTGEAQVVQLGSPRRLKVIYDSNMRSARAAGQWERIERTKKALPYLEYRLGPSEHHRPAHEAKAGLILPVDSSFWNSWMPPNGWACKCWVRQVTRAEAERRGVSEEPEVPTRTWTNTRTGEVQDIPRGIDPGWQRNPGKMRMQSVEQMLEDKLNAAHPAIQRAATRDIATSWRAERVLEGKAPGAVPIAVVPQEIAEGLGVGTRLVKTTSDYGRKFVMKERQVDSKALLSLQDALDRGTLILENTEAGNALIAIDPDNGTDRPWLFALKVLSDENEIWLRTMHRLKPNKAKLKALLANPRNKVLREGK